MQSFVLMIKKDPTIIALLLANVIPVFGFLFLEWSVLSVIFVYWVESVVIGLYTIPKILISGIYTAVTANTKSIKQFVMPFVYVPFFCFHFFGVLGGTMLGIFAITHIPEELFEKTFLQELANLSQYAVLGFVFSHGISFIVNYLGKKEYQRVSAETYIFSPYVRIILMNLVIFFGGLLTLGNVIPAVFMLIFIVGKINIDIALHVREHRT